MTMDNRRWTTDDGQQTTDNVMKIFLNFQFLNFQFLNFLIQNF